MHRTITLISIVAATCLLGANSSGERPKSDEAAHMVQPQSGAPAMGAEGGGDRAETLQDLDSARASPMEEAGVYHIAPVFKKLVKVTVINFLFHSELTKGEVKVVLGDRLLEEGVGYEVDYEQGIVTIVDKAIEKKGAKYYISAGDRAIGNHKNEALILKLLHD